MEIHVILLSAATHTMPTHTAFLEDGINDKFYPEKASA